MSKFLHDYDNNDAKAIAIPWVFSESNRAKNGGKFSKSVENTVRKGDIARYEQFLIFPQFFF